MMQRRYILSVLSLILLFSGCHKRPKIEPNNEWKKYYEQYGVQGSFVLYNENKNSYTVYNEQQFTMPFIPASTFKICNSLIGLETGIIKDENFVIPWDSVRRNRVWDNDHDLKSAFKNSTVWYYQELARRVGKEKMKYWIDMSQYGNMDTTGGIDKFWLEGSLRVSPLQQVDFLQRLNNEKLPFSKRSIDIVKKIMVEADTLGYVLRSKTGWGTQGKKDIGWYIGYIQTKENVYYFANCVQIDGEKLNDNETSIMFNNARRSIAKEILKSMGILNQE